MKRQKSLLSLLLALLMVCNMIVPVSAEGANEPILTVTASKTELDVSEGTADVIYTVSLNPNGNNICAFQFELAAPEGMKLTQDPVDENAGEGADGYWINDSLLYHSKYNKTGTFTTFEYAPTTGYFGASGGLADRCLTETTTIMTIKATVDVSNAKTYTLGVSKFICYGAGSVNFGGAAPAVTDVVVKGAAHTCSADTLTEIPAKAHTCTEDGNYKYYRCTCGELYEDADAKISTTAEKVIDKAAHTDLKKTEAKEPTCDSNGCVAYWFCTGCDNYYFDNNGAVGKKTTVEKVAIPATGHKWVLVVGGYKEGAPNHTIKCSVCGQKKDEAHADRPGDESKKWESDKDSHWNVYGCGTIMNKAAHTWNEGVVTKGATCTEPGEKIFTCDVCKATKTEPIPVIAHQYEWKHDETNHWQECSVCGNTIDKAAHTFDTNNCAEDRTCNKCGFKKTAGEHSWNAGEVTTPATCTTDGVKTYTCKVCSETKTEPIAALGHAYGEPAWNWGEDGKTATATFTCTREGCTAETTGHAQTVTATVSGKQKVAPTCTDKGTTTYTATVTFEGKNYSATKDVEDIAKIAHTLTATPAKAATCTEPGNNAYWTCDICGQVFKDEQGTQPTTVDAETINATGHTPKTDWTTDGDYHWHVCDKCGAVVGDKAAHTFDTNDCAVDRKCTICSYEKKAGQHTWGEKTYT